MDDLAVLPVFLKLVGKRAVMAGGTAPAVWKTELLSAAGAQVEVLATEPCHGLLDLAEDPPLGPIRLVRRAWTASDLAGAAIAIGAIEDDAEAVAFRDAARRAGVPVNVVDKPAFCDFQFGTIVNRSPLVVGISTDGAAPVFGQAVRALVEAVLPQGLQRWAGAARDWRPAVQALGLDFRGRRHFWEAFAERAVARSGSLPTPADLVQFKAQALAEAQRPQGAVVTLVGAGPAGSDEVTLKAVRALQAADVVVYSADVDEATVGLARREALKFPVPAETDIATETSLLLPLLQPGRRVAWLDRGNPDACRRWSKREDLLKSQDISISSVAGLGLCRDCKPGCPAWPT